MCPEQRIKRKIIQEQFANKIGRRCSFFRFGILLIFIPLDNSIMLTAAETKTRKKSV